MAFAGVVYGLLTLTYNYRSVWLFVGNAQRLTIDLFIVLLLLPFAAGPNRPAMPRALKLLWAASAIFLLFAAQEAPDVRMAFLGKFVQF